MAMQPDRGELNPEYVATVEFTLARRGYEPAEVRNLLKEVAQHLASLQARQSDLTRRLAAADAAAPAALGVDDVDEADLTAILGEKTTQVLQSAREAAADIHRRAVDKAREMVDQATADTQRMRAETEGTLRASKDRAEEMERKADQRAKQVTRAAESEADRATSDGEQALRGARQQATEILAESEAAAQAVTLDAGDHAARSRAKADTLVTAGRAEAEQLEAETQTRVTRLLRETEEAVAARHAETAAEVARMLAAAEADSERIDADARHLATRTEETGRESGRRLVAEAMTARETVLRELARQRRNAQVQLAQLRVGRDRLLEAYAIVEATALQATSELDGVVTDARMAAETAADDRVVDETKLSLEQLEAEFGIDRLREVAVLDDREPAAEVEAVEDDAAAGDPGDVDEAVDVDLSAPAPFSAPKGNGARVSQV